MSTRMPMTRKVVPSPLTRSGPQRPAWRQSADSPGFELHVVVDEGGSRLRGKAVGGVAQHGLHRGHSQLRDMHWPMRAVTRVEAA